MSALFRRISAAAFILMSGLVSTPGLSDGRHRIFIMPKLVGISYYDAVKQGVDEAAHDIADVEVTWSGPAQDQVDKHIEMLEKIIPTGPDVIAVAANDPAKIVPVLRKASAAGIRVMSWDGDSNFREFFVNLVDFDAFGAQLVDAIAAEVGPRAPIAIVTTSFFAPNQSSWLAAIKRRMYASYPEIQLLDIRPAGESTEQSYRIAWDYLKTFPTLRGIIALGVPNLPGVAQAVKDAGLAGKVAVVGNSTPDLMRSYLADGTVKKVLLWNAPDHGYLTVYSAYRLIRGELSVGQAFAAGRLGSVTPRRDAISMQVALPIIVFDKHNVDRYRF